MNPAIFLSLYLFSAGDGETLPKPIVNPDFTLEAQVVEALEGGPVVLKVTLQYNGKKSLRYYRDAKPKHAFLHTYPEGWVGGISPPGHFIGRVGTAIMDPGDMQTEILFPHLSYSSIRSAKTNIDVGWNIYDGDDENKLIAAPRTKLELNILPANDDNVAALRKRLQEKVSRTKLPIEDKQVLVKSIQGTKHRGLIPVALQILETKDSDYHESILTDFVLQFPDAADEVQPRLVKLATDPAMPDPTSIFNSWRRAKCELSDRQYKDLLTSDNVWARALTYVTFPNRCDKAWKETLFRELEVLQQPLPADRFAALVTKLDNEDFDVRESATTELRRAGVRVQKQLQAARDGSLSPEAKSRVQALLDGLKPDEPRPQTRSILKYLAWTVTPESGEVLEHLAKGDLDPWLAKEAKEALQEYRKNSQKK